MGESEEEGLSFPRNDRVNVESSCYGYLAAAVSFQAAFQCNKRYFVFRMC